ncbi:MAG: ThiF family adenylyltransferase [Nitrospirae bacterium]|nr:MAG: ThiF family adenylyltransferase [Nitrospirota bacterium]
MSRVKLRITGRQYATIKRHLFPGDGCEAVAVGLCGRHNGSDEHILTLRTVVPISHADCERDPCHVKWPTGQLLPLLEEAAKRNMAIVKIHSHPTGTNQFSSTDDKSDDAIFSSVYAWTDTDDPHVSLVMVPNGDLWGRVILESGAFAPLSSVAVAGDDLLFWYPGAPAHKVPEFARRHAQLFGAGTTTRLRNLTIGIVGCSGTGSIVVELLARLGVGRLILVDPDRVEEKNLNRIINATKEDAFLGRFKVEVAARVIAQMGLGTEVQLIRDNLITPDSVKALAASDVVFGCMDGAEGRYVLNRLATFYLIPYFDVGIRLDADGEGGIAQVCGTVHALQPDGSSLLSRGVYTMDRVEAEGVMRTNRALYEKQVRQGYLRGVDEERPAVVSVNMQLASMAVNEFLARLHPYRYDKNSGFAVVRSSLIQGHTYCEPEGTPCQVLSRHVGRGDVTPLLDMPELSV